MKYCRLMAYSSLMGALITPAWALHTLPQGEDPTLPTPMTTAQDESPLLLAGLGSWLRRQLNPEPSHPQPPRVIPSAPEPAKPNPISTPVVTPNVTPTLPVSQAPSTPPEEPTLEAAFPPGVVGRARIDWIRVGLSDDAMERYDIPKVVITATTGFGVFSQPEGNLLLTWPAQTLVTLTRSKGVFYAEWAGSNGPQALPSASVWLQPQLATGQIRIANITRQGKPPQYKGFLHLLPAKASESNFTVVNVLLLQDYLKAVVPNELPVSFGVEALKAQSVAARNYALFPREKNWHGFDICDSQACQVYFGAQSEHPQANAALAQTEGLLAYYDGKPILALYSSSHGGHSEDYANVFTDPKSGGFPAPAIPYLRGKPDKPEVLHPLLLQRGGTSCGILDPNTKHMTPALRQESCSMAYWASPADAALKAAAFDSQTSLFRWERTVDAPTLTRQVLAQLQQWQKSPSVRSLITGPNWPNQAPTPQSFGRLIGLQVTERGVSGKAMALTLTTEVTAPPTIVPQSTPLLATAVPPPILRQTWVVRKEYWIRQLLKAQGKALPSANIVIQPLAPGKTATVPEAPPFPNATAPAPQLTGWRILGGGFGHGVGMSQYGAGALAKAGWTFDRILQHYYTGITLGSRQLTLTPQEVAAIPSTEKTTLFVPPKAWGRLWVEGPANQTLSLKLNGHTVSVSTGHSGRGVAWVGDQLKPHALNALTLSATAINASMNAASVKLTAWVEVVPATPLP